MVNFEVRSVLEFTVCIKERERDILLAEHNRFEKVSVVNLVLPNISDRWQTPHLSVLWMQKLRAIYNIYGIVLFILLYIYIYFFSFSFEYIDT